ncbi:MAG: ATPase [Lachnospiraceae bacterium]|jgi:N-acetylglucosamine kinase-like BadF-type ATPase|nr:ATPase [Lachnospiraceae bacterium]
MKYYAGLDIGGTSGRIILSDENGQVLERLQTGGVSIFSGGEKAARKKYEELVFTVLKKRKSEPSECEGICVAATGIDSEALRECVRDIFLDMGFPRSKLYVFNDCEVFLQVYKAPSLILIGGTGSISFGQSRSGAMVRTGGWGHILSDEGSGFHIGLEIVKAVGEHLDRRSHDETLYQMFYETTGISDLEALNNFLNANIMTKNAIADLAPLAEEAMNEGSEAAREILEGTIQKLYRIARDNYQKMTVDKEDTLNLIFWGSVLHKNKMVQRGVAQLVREHIPNVEIQIPQKQAVEIALEVALGGQKEKILCY